MKVFLVGMMGTGKTTLGKMLAQRLDCSFFDSDEMIVGQTGSSVDTIFNECGEDYFRALERTWLDSIESLEGVFATGGGLPCYNDNMDRMNELGLTIYLNTSIDVILDRLANDHKRPILKNKSLEERQTVLRTLLEQRSTHYKKSKYIIDCNNEVPFILEETLAIINYEVAS